jgi:hypothetical protein
MPQRDVRAYLEDINNLSLPRMDGRGELEEDGASSPRQTSAAATYGDCTQLDRLWYSFFRA